jgi:transposase
VDWSRVCIDASHVKAKKKVWGSVPRRSTGGKPGSKHHVVCDGEGLPLKVITTGGNVPDIAMAESLIAAIPPGVSAAPGRNPMRYWPTRDMTRAAFWAYLEQRGILAVISQRKRPDIIGLGGLRWVVERTIAPLHQFRRLATRWERRLDL